MKRMRLDVAHIYIFVFFKLDKQLQSYELKCVHNKYTCIFARFGCKVTISIKNELDCHYVKIIIQALNQVPTQI